MEAEEPPDPEDDRIDRGYRATLPLARRWIAHARSGEWSVAQVAARWAEASGLTAGRLEALAAHLVEGWPLPQAGHAPVAALAAWLRTHADFRRLAPATDGWVLEAPLPLEPLQPAPRPPAIPGALPAATLVELATLLRSEPGELLWLSGLYAHGEQRPADQHYRRRLVPKRSGAPRLLEIPKERLKRLQRRLLDQLLAPLPVSPHAHGFVPGRSALSHARLHVGARAILKLDLADFFLRIGLARVRTQFLRMGYSAPLSSLLARLCTVACRNGETLQQLPEGSRALARERHLAQGAPTSPALANLVAVRLDVRLAAYAASRGWRYSRYADDLTFSSLAQPPELLRLGVPQLDAIVTDAGFRLQPAKTRLHGAHRQQTVTGIVVNARLNADRASFDRLRAELHAWTLGRGQPQHGEDRASALARLRGRIAWMVQLNPRRARRLLGLWERIPSA